VIRDNLNMTVIGHAGLSEQQISQKTIEEDKRVTDDLEVIETAELKNTLESYIYETKSALTDDWSEFVAEKDKNEFIDTLKRQRTGCIVAKDKKRRKIPIRRGWLI